MYITSQVYRVLSKSISLPYPPPPSLPQVKGSLLHEIDASSRLLQQRVETSEGRVGDALHCAADRWVAHHYLYIDIDIDIDIDRYQVRLTERCGFHCAAPQVDQ